MRYFVLKHGILYYSKTKEDQPLGLVYLKRNYVSVKEAQKKNEFRLTVSWPDRTYHLAAENRSEWIEKIEMALLDDNTSTPIRSADKEMSLEQILQSKEGFAYFQSFLEVEFAVENLFFYVDVKRFVSLLFFIIYYYYYYFFSKITLRYQTLTDAEDLKKEFNVIFDKFFGVEAPYAVNVPYEISEHVTIIKDNLDEKVLFFFHLNYFYFFYYFFFLIFFFFPSFLCDVVICVEVLITYFELN
jgi:hypothetical protein